MTLKASLQFAGQAVADRMVVVVFVVTVVVVVGKKNEGCVVAFVAEVEAFEGAPYPGSHVLVGRATSEVVVAASECYAP
jgi:hypothetical protein